MYQRAFKPVTSGSLTFRQGICILIYIALCLTAGFIGGRTYTAEVDVLEGDARAASLLAAGRALGLVAVFMLTFQLVLSARIKFLDRAFGLDKLLRWHRVTAVVALLLGLAHPMILFATEQYDFSRIAMEHWAVYVGSMTLAFLVIIMCTSLFRIFLELEWEKWKFIHYLTFVTIIMGSVHGFVMTDHLRSGWPLVFWSILLLAFFWLAAWKKFIKPARLASRAYIVTRIEQLNHNVCNVVLQSRSGRTISYMPGQFAFIRFLRNMKHGEEHPFTISSAPGGTQIAFTIKGSGDFTGDIPNMKVGTPVAVDGPYGHFSPFLRRRRDLVMIAGGIGITPFISILRFIAETGSDRRITLIWANRTEADLFLQDEFEEIKEELPTLRVIHIISEQPDYKGLKGRPGKNLFKHVLEAEDMRAHAYICGPPAMMDMAKRGLLACGIPKRRVFTEYFSI